MSADDVLVRRVRPEEYAEVSRLRLAAYAHDYELGEEYAADVADVARHDREGEVWVAEEHGAILATVTTAAPGATLYSLGRPGELDWRLLAVAPEARGRGLGRLLTEFVVMLAVERGLQRVVMNSGTDMLAAHALYESMGFVRLPERENPPGIEPTRTYGLDL
ncbi:MULTISPECIES: GNAT family N-acetyltransferase [unclassified Rathayibacter]|uniref:GNAT family N-acetyltransferase n=1 Tax=unclassified Rathayibacter TaxID=2609250 RepID=UPI000F4CDBD2|nr:MULTISPECIES: GNAT family N-acetyltransferase [unclassified Rathayibacter]MCJ1673064.1 GNAT family N-acetyltransferase [Rathayibacter sp. VKM Ac-2929]MCJ1682560.1 GNAT family N-acetyltransferase [Rathayibacter sp. VKM Ac-2928]MCJ1685508.1 GNAT family N-acetyltransferase [Rathayibacter sp. VKM Ac-2927]ROP57884.1 ribosomal protein S18 acetylase RimI-like enzyme [Rathayibacter sp. PhB186]ROQ64018.1 ribosomal protein S18 acetylase RimI-like enzyme [Rathayibacter sp. PhB152]